TNGTATCVSGACAIQCKSGFHLCGGKCVDNKSMNACGPNDITSCSPCVAPTGGSVTCDGLACRPECTPGSTKLCSGACIPTANACMRMCPSRKHNCSGVCQSDTSTGFCTASCIACATPTSNGSATCDPTT